MSTMIKSNDNGNNENTEVKMVGTIPENSRLEMEAEPFKKIANVTRTNTKSLSLLIKSKFKPIFHDLKGVFIQYAGNNMFLTSFAFEYNPSSCGPDEIRNLIPVNQRADNKYRGGDLFDQNRRLQERYSGKTYELTDETKLLLAPFMYGDAKQNHYKSKNWNSRITEHKESTNLSAPFMYQQQTERVYVVVQGIDLLKILRLIYGNKMVSNTVIDENGKLKNNLAKAFYNIRFHKMDPDNNLSAIISIEQIDKEQVEEQIQYEAPKYGMRNPGAFMFW